MYTIPYFLINEAKNLIKVKINEITNNITDEIINNIFYSTPDNKNQNLMLNLDKDIRIAILKIIKEVIEIFDNLYANSKERKKQFNISNPRCHRSIMTIFGELEFDRIYYYDKKDKNKHFYFIDTLFGFSKYDRYDKLVKAIAISNAMEINQKKGAEITNDRINSLEDSISGKKICNVSRQDIYIWIDKWNVPDVQLEPIDIDGDTLYIMIDEKYIHEQIKILLGVNTDNDDNIETKNNKEIIKEIADELMNSLNNPLLLLPAPKNKTKKFIMSKAFVAFTGMDVKGARRTLENKVTFLTSSKQTWQDFMDFIPTIFDFSKIKNIKVLSDAGTWITAGIYNLKLFVENIIIPCLCIFHAKQKINRSTKNEDLQKQLYGAIDADDKKKFVELFNPIMEGKSEKRVEKLQSYKKYILSHWNAIKNMKASKYKSSMESHISHDVAKYFSYEPKAYGQRHIEKPLKLRQHQLNGVNIISLYLNTCDNTEKVTVKKEEISFKIFERSSSNMPILYSNNSCTTIALRGLVA